MSKDTLIELVKDSPTVAVGGLTLLGVSLSDYVLVLTLGWAAWRLVAAVVEFYWKWKDRQNARK